MDKIIEDKIKQAVNIVDIIGDFITLRKRGVEYQGLCPFHKDKTLGNFSVNPSKGIFKCFSCGAGGDAIEFLMKHERLSYGDALHYLAHKYSIPVEDDYDRERFKNIKPSQPKPIVEQRKDMLVMEREMVLKTMHDIDRDYFVTWLRHLPWESHGERGRLENMLWLYCVGHWSDGRVVFWQIDEQGRPRSGKLMKYQLDGHRDRTRGPGWMHNQQGVREQYDLDHQEYRATLFGMHLTRKFPNAIIHLVESEKTALICATHYGDPDRNLWLACGGLNFLRIEALKPLIKQRRIIHLWPDKDGLTAWEKTRNAIVDNYPQASQNSIKINTTFLQRNWLPEDGSKADVADIILRIMWSKSTAGNEELRACREWTAEKGDAPFVDQEEQNDPDLHAMREKLRISDWRRRHPSTPLPTPPHIDGMTSVGEVLQQHPLLKKLIE